jgi:hypothetical protein
MAKDDRVIPLPGKSTMSEFMVPAQDKLGHSATVHCRVPPGMLRDIEKLMVHKEVFGWETQSDFLRWAIRYGFDYAAKRSNDKQILNYGAERRAMEEALIEEQQHMMFKTDMEKVEKTVQMMESDGHRDRIVPLLLRMKERIARIEEKYWREHWRKEFTRKFNYYLRPVSLTDFDDGDG